MFVATVKNLAPARFAIKIRQNPASARFGNSKFGITLPNIVEIGQHVYYYSNSVEISVCIYYNKMNRRLFFDPHCIIAHF